ncbi:hypothetical protein ANCCEY_07928 [Ancylostoma ceylanicum]|uniref:Transthyretin-like family protein n=1 Tax=Ancylostoma ceylanicum TaxID=53326 RepID=A0A0D6LSG2_9BILA|nr:hypothetical protein ANCCEY_07928 [Ancylostoma ceylanicum]
MYRVVSIIALLVVCKAMRDQSIAVKGRFLCGSKPAAKVRVKLIDVDTARKGGFVQDHSDPKQRMIAFMFRFFNVRLFLPKYAEILKNILLEFEPVKQFE